MSTNSEVVNLDNCAREPIHIPGAIQPHGLLFVLREPDMTIIQVSENVREFLGVLPEDLFGGQLTQIMSSQQVERVKAALSVVDPRENNPVELQLETKNGTEPLDGFVHRHEGFSFLEMESSSLAQSSRFLGFYKQVSKLTSRLHNMPSMDELLQEACEGVRQLTGFDRIMIYRFASNNEGQVVAEAKAEGVEPYLGLWYPASDIPEQARRLYVLNPIRCIVDSSYVPSLLYPVINPDTKRPTDLSYTGLRSVSPIHCEYLRNMGVTASMSVSILRDDRLWGLVACHHFSPNFVPYETRKACTFIGEVLSGEISRRELESDADYQSQAVVVQAKFLESMAASADPLLGLVNSSPNLLNLVPSEGAAVVHEDKAHMLGSTPSYEDVLTIVDLLQCANVASTFATSSLQNHFPMTEAMRATGSGLIALEIARNPATYVLFFRPEVAQTVLWGGNPEKPVTPSDDGFRLSPRKSFEVWREETRGRAMPWTPAEIRVAGELRNLISVVGYTKRASA